MLPRVIAYNRNNYAGHMSVYWCEMVLLPQTHPYSNALLVDGQFAVQRSAFAQVPVDHTIEQTMNRDSKTNGGIVAISRSRSELEPNSSRQMNILQTCREMEGMYDAASKHHKDASAPQMKKVENDVNKAMHTIEIWVNPFK